MNARDVGLPKPGAVADRGRAQLPPHRLLSIVLTSLALTAVIAVAMIAVVLEFQAGATAYIAGEGHWSKGQQEAVFHMLRYTQNQQPEALNLAREALQRPLGDHDARLALQQSPVDLERARIGFLQGGNAAVDVPRMIRLFRLMPNAPYFKQSITTWMAADVHILQLRDLIGEMEQAQVKAQVEGKRLSEAEARTFQSRISALDALLRPAEVAFSQSLLNGSRVLQQILLAGSAIILLLLVVIAISALRAVMRRAQESERSFQAAFDQAAVGMLKMDAEGLILDANAALSEILGYPHRAIVGMNIRALLHADEQAELLPTRGGRIWIDQTIPTDRRFVCRDGSTLWGRWTASVVRGDMTSSEDEIFAILEDTSKARLLAGELAHQGSHDALTGLINRREIIRRLQSLVDHARSDTQTHLLCLIDLDQFKLFNDECGHAVGDLLLRHLANALQRELRSQDWVGRLGGDEFAVLLTDASREQAQALAGDLHQILAKATFRWQGQEHSITASIGVVEIRSDTPDVSWLLRAADAACYQAKDEGRNRIRLYQDSDTAIARRQGDMIWVESSRRAMADHRMHLYAQKIVSATGNDEVMYEVLLRMCDERGHLQSPALFLPALERYGLAETIDRHVLNLLFKQFTAHPNHVARLGLCHVNVSGQSVAEPGFRDFVLSLLRSGIVPPAKVCFEITETAVMENLIEARAFIDAVRREGCMIAMDDFGSGLSSFAYLKNLQVDFLKIDGAFVRELDVDDVDYALVHSICDLGRTLGKRTIAEWVESDAVRDRLLTIGVDYLQGYALHRPCLLEDLMRSSSREVTPIRSIKR